MHIEYFKWNGYLFNFQGYDNVFTNVGVHQNLDDRTITASKNVKGWWGPGRYIACVNGWIGTRTSGADVYGNSPAVCTSEVSF